MTEDNRRENIKEEYIDGLHFVEYLPEPATQVESRADRRKREGKKAWLVACLALVMVMLAGTLAWYVLNAIREIDSKDTEVMTPYLLYLLNPTDEKSLALTVGNLHPGETKQAVICVSSQKPEDIGIMTISKDSEFSYELELAYTENLAVDYNVYELETVEAGDDTTSDGLILVQDENGENTKYFKKAGNEKLANANVDVNAKRQKEMYGGNETSRQSIVNLGQYDLYQADAAGNNLKLNTKVFVENDEVQYDKDYYLIEITWKQTDANGASIQFDDYRKETDLVYVIVKAMQPEPKEDTINTTETTEASE